MRQSSTMPLYKYFPNRISGLIASRKLTIITKISYFSLLPEFFLHLMEQYNNIQIPSQSNSKTPLVFCIRKKIKELHR